jgi:DNA-binding NtrC family response regulator
VLELILREDGYLILDANSAREGYELLALNSVNVILCDERMPDISGTEFFRNVKDLYPSTLRIAMSGYGDPESITAAVNEGAIFKYLLKPLDYDAVRMVVGDAFGHVRLGSTDLPK